MPSLYDSAPDAGFDVTKQSVIDVLLPITLLPASPFRLGHLEQPVYESVAYVKLYEYDAVP